MAYTDQYDFPTLFRVVEAFPQDSTYLVDTFSKVGEAFPDDEIEIQTMKGHRPLAPYVNELLPGKVILRTGFSAKQYKPALLKPMRIITRHDLKVRQAGENLINPKSPEERYNDLVAKDLVDLNSTISRREVQQLAELMFTGKVTQIGEGVDQELDWDFENYEVLSGDDLFSNQENDISAFLQEWKLRVMNGSGVTPTRILTTAEVATAIMRHATVLALIKTDNTAVLTPGQLNQEIRQDGVIFHGTLTQIGLSVYSYTNSYTNEEGDVVPYIPAGTLALLPDGQPFTFHYGANLIMDTDGNFKFVQGRITPQVLTTIEPPSRKVQFLSRPICVPDNVNGWFVAKVL